MSRRCGSHSHASERQGYEAHKEGGLALTGQENRQRNLPPYHQYEGAGRGCVDQKGERKRAGATAPQKGDELKGDTERGDADRTYRSALLECPVHYVPYITAMTSP